MDPPLFDVKEHITHHFAYYTPTATASFIIRAAGCDAGHGHICWTVSESGKTLSASDESSFPFCVHVSQSVKD